MATYDNAYISVAGTDLSSYLTQLDISEGAEMIDDTVMGDSTRSQAAGLNTRTVTAVFIQDYGSATVHETISAVVGPDLTASVITAHNGATPSATNPTTTQTMVVSEYQPQAGSVGEQHFARVTFVAAGDSTEATA